MVIEKVHGLQATALTMDQRFTLLAAAAPDRVIRQKQRPIAPFLNQTFNNRNRDLIDVILRELGYHQQKQNMLHGMGMRQGLRRYGSESSLPGLRRAHSFGNLSQHSIRNRLRWNTNNNNIIKFRNRSRSVSVSSAPGGQHANTRQRARFRNNRGRIQGSNVGSVRSLRRGASVGRRGAARGGARGASRGGARGASRGGARPRGNWSNRGGITRPQTPKPLPTREELDAQLDHYMAGTKAALDKEIEDYMKEAMDLDVVL